MTDFSGSFAQSQEEPQVPISVQKREKLTQCPENFSPVGQYLQNPYFNQSTLDPWDLDTNSGATCTSSLQPDGLFVLVTNPGAEYYNIQLVQKMLFQANTIYKVRV